MSEGEFKKLQKEWYEKLAESGFNDIENTEDEYAPLKDTYSTSGWKRALSDPRNVQKEEYFSNATLFLDTYEFVKQKDEIVWRLHSEGMSNRSISKELRGMGFNKKVAPRTIDRIINKYKEIMLRGF